MFLLCLISCDKDDDQQEENTEVEFVQEVEEIKEDWEPLENDEQIISLLSRKQFFFQRRIKNYLNNKGEYIEEERNYPRYSECSASYEFSNYNNNSCWFRGYCDVFSEVPYTWKVENSRLIFDYDDYLTEYIVEKNSDDKIKFTLYYIAPYNHYHDNYTNLVLEEIFYIE